MEISIVVKCPVCSIEKFISADFSGADIKEGLAYIIGKHTTLGYDDEFGECLCPECTVSAADVRETFKNSIDSMRAKPRRPKNSVGNNIE